MLHEESFQMWVDGAKVFVSGKQETAVPHARLKGVPGVVRAQDQIVLLELRPKRY